MHSERFRSACVALVSAALVSMGAQVPAAASVVPTAEAVSAAQGDARAVVDSTLARADVQARLAEMGVDRTAIEGRLAALSPDEMQTLADQIQSAPAGGDFLAVDRHRVRGADHPRARRRHRHLQEGVSRSAPVLAALAVALAGCAASPPLAAGLPATAPRAIELAATPFFPQVEYQCGPAALATLLVASGVPVTPEALAPEVYLPERHGSLALELVGAARRHGRLPWVLATTADEMVDELEAGRPVLLLQNLGVQQIPVWHYAVLIGYDAERNVAILRSGDTERLEMKWQRFAGAWHRGGRFAMSVLRPGEIPAYADPARFIETAAGLEAAGRRDAAATAYDAAVARWPAEPLAWLGRGNVAYAEGDRTAAADAWMRAILLNPEDAAARNNLAELLLEAGCLDESRRQVEHAAALAEGTALAPAVADSRAKIEATAVAAGHCQFEGRSWPD